MPEGVFEYKGRMLAHSWFEKSLLQIYKPNFRPQYIIDIGSFDGGDSIRFKNWYPSSTIYAIEASPACFKKIQWLTDEGIQIYNVAISDYTGKTRFFPGDIPAYYSDGAPNGTTVPVTDAYYKTHPHAKFFNPIEIDCITLDDFCDNNNIPFVDIAHIDTEGASCKVIRGMKKFTPKLVFIESMMDGMFDCTDTDQELDYLLLSRGYRKVYSSPADYLYLKERDTYERVEQSV